MPTLARRKLVSTFVEMNPTLSIEELIDRAYALGLYSKNTYHKDIAWVFRKCRARLGENTEGSPKQ